MENRTSDDDSCWKRKRIIPNGLTMKKADRSSQDYHEQINKINYENWIKEKQLENFELPNVAALDNTSYHNTDAINAPTSNNKKVK